MFDMSKLQKEGNCREGINGMGSLMLQTMVLPDLSELLQRGNQYVGLIAERESYVGLTDATKCNMYNC